MNDGYSIGRADYKLYESYIYAIVQSKAVVREAIEETGGLVGDDADDSRNEIDKVPDKGICCAAFQFVKN